MPTLLSFISWDMSVDEDGHRTYHLTSRVKCSKEDGPYTIYNTPGLPQPGSIWSLGNDTDPYAWCRFEAELKPFFSDGEPNTFWDVTNTFSTKPPDYSRCQDTPITDPLSEPQRVSGGFSKYTKEATFDRFGLPIVNSAYEQIRGQNVEFDEGRPTVSIEQNVPSLELEILSLFYNTVNAYPLWGLASRCVKLSNVSWERKLYGQCFVYYTRKFEFEIDYYTFDRNLLDEGTKCLNGHWNNQGKWQLDPINGAPPDPLNPAHYIKATDRLGNPMKVLLNGNGLPVYTAEGTGTGGVSPGTLHIEKYNESDFLYLGIPVNLNDPLA